MKRADQPGDDMLVPIVVALVAFVLMHKLL